ncbi:MAG: ATP-binding cassette domain-containing protein [Planctomycetes bacterium]|nr:ATP-binding cassette domain-containing protein [Planctomycetota bacterium]
MSLELVQVTRRYGTQLALDRLSIHVRDGDLYGFLGHNGAGKTTAMRIVLGLVPASSGQVVVDGFDAVRYPKEARARLGGLIEVPGFHGHLDGRRNLGLLARVQGLGRREAAVEVERLLGVVGLAKTGTKAVQAYSHGMRQRLGIAQALMGSPRYVLLDEPMNGLDPEGIAEVREILRRAARESGTTVLFSTHQLHEVEGLCNRVGVLYRGRLVIEADTATLFAAARGRHRIESAEPARVGEWLAARGLSSNVVGEQLELELAERSPAELLRDLVRAELPIRAFAPRPASLEEIYLSHTRAAREATASPESEGSAPRELSAPGEGSALSGLRAPAGLRAPQERRAPGGAVWRVVRYELTRVFAARSVCVLVLLPAAVGVAAILERRQELQRSLEKVENAELFSATDVTAFEAVARALGAGLPILALAIAGLASQTLASELARNTLRNLLLRPVRRLEVVAGKALALVGVATLGFAALAASALAVGAACFDFGDVTEVLPNGERFALVEAGALWPELWRALAFSFPPVLAYGALGLLAGSLLRGAAPALALAFGGYVFLDLARAFARAWDVEAWLPSAYLPSPLGDTSFVRTFGDLSQGVSNASFEYAQGAWSVPSLWIVACFLLTTWRLSRRQVA